MNIEYLRTWIGREERASQFASPEPVAGLAALLDHVAPPWPAGEVPPLGHWLYFLPQVPQSQIGPDGHPLRGGFLPPVELPRRMWVGGRLRFHAPVRIGSRIERVSTIEDIVPKQGATGALLFVTVRHVVCTNGQLAVEEWQDLVYRGHRSSTAPAPAGQGQPTAADASRTLTPDPVALFRYSALTFNGHRIHYDRTYACDIEGYPGLVVHGPYAATLLMDLFLSEKPRHEVTGFSFKALQPLFDTAPFTVNLRHDATSSEAWAAPAAGGAAAMTARIDWKPRRLKS